MARQNANMVSAMSPVLTAASVMKENFQAYMGTTTKSMTLQNAARALNQWRAR
jgi:hypothetical protein